MGKPILLVFNSSKNRWEELYSFNDIVSRQTKTVAFTNEYESNYPDKDNQRIIIPGSAEEKVCPEGWIPLSDICIAKENVLTSLDVEAAKNNADAIFNAKTVSDNLINYSWEGKQKKLELWRVNNQEEKDLIDFSGVIPFDGTDSGYYSLTYNNKTKDLKWAIPPNNEADLGTSITLSRPIGIDGNTKQSPVTTGSDGKKFLISSDGKSISGKVHRLCYGTAVTNDKNNNIFQKSPSGYLQCNKSGYIQVSANCDMYFPASKKTIKDTANPTLKREIPGKPEASRYTFYWKIIRYRNGNWESDSSMAVITDQIVGPRSHTSCIAPKVIKVEAGDILTVSYTFDLNASYSAAKDKKTKEDIFSVPLLQYDHPENTFTATYLGTR